jgi:hypothetical protein
MFHMNFETFNNLLILFKRYCGQNNFFVEGDLLLLCNLFIYLFISPEKKERVKYRLVKMAEKLAASSKKEETKIGLGLSFHMSFYA